MAADEKQIWSANGGQPLILALSGGGIRGYYTARVLARVEALLGAPCWHIFDAIAGTSIGGIVALALAHGVPAGTIADTIGGHGAKIFPRWRFAGARRIFGPPYRADAIRGAFQALLPDKYEWPLQSSLQRVMVVTASPVSARLIAARSWDENATGRMATIDAALATSAAPTYFPAHYAKLDERTVLELIDGGIAANAPDALAIHLTVTELGFPEDRIAMFSVGACGRATGGVSGARPNASGFVGAIARLGGRGIVDLMMAIQEDRGVSEATAKLGALYLRMDETPSDAQAKHLALDDASVTALRTLDALAVATGERLAKLGQNPVWRLMTARAQR